MCVHHSGPAETTGVRNALCALALEPTVTSIRPTSPTERVQRDRVRIEPPQRATAAAVRTGRPTPEEWREVIARGSRLRLGAHRIER